METHVTGRPALSELRHALCAVIFGNPLFSPQEQLLTNHHIHDCEDAEQLARWLANIPTALAKRRRPGRVVSPGRRVAALQMPLPLTPGRFTFTPYLPGAPVQPLGALAYR